MSKKKVITVSGDSSKWYDKVIFVVKKEQNQNYENIDFVLEAENIISNYMLNSKMEVGKAYNVCENTNKSRNLAHSKIDMFLYSSISVCIFLISYLIIQSF